MDMALRIANIRPVHQEGLLWGFHEKFGVLSRCYPKIKKCIILAHERDTPGWAKLFLDKEGAWLTEEGWSDSKQTNEATMDSILPEHVCVLYALHLRQTCELHNPG
jgi:hypothetical protein